MTPSGGKRVAMRENGVVYFASGKEYLHGDHLVSTSLVAYGSTGGCKGTPDQGVVAEQLYLPFGTPRWIIGTLPTDFTYAGQRADVAGLMYYPARYYAAHMNTVTRLSSFRKIARVQLWENS